MNRRRSTFARPALVMTWGALALATAACAGPRVGEIVGNPSSTTMTIQARVVSSTPVVAQVAVPRQVCYDELRQEPARSSGAGAVVGAIAGGAMGNAIGKGAGRAVTTGLGVILGAAVGDHIETDGRTGTTRSVQHCEQQNSYQNQVVAYNVVYEYGGQRYSTQMKRQPGATIPVSVTVNPGAQGGNYDDEQDEPVSYYQPAQPVIVAPVVSRYYVRPIMPIAPVYYRPGIEVRDWDRRDHWQDRRHDRDDHRDDRDDRREGHGSRDDGRPTFHSRWD